MAEFELTLPESELNLELCVSSGQVFRWEKLGDGSWIGVDGPNWYRVSSFPSNSEREGNTIRYGVESNATRADFERLFRLEEKLQKIEAAILERGPELAPLMSALRGLRVLRSADPEEVLFTFLCTPNNNLERITKMVRNLAEYGAPMGEVEGRVLYRFPTVERIAGIDEHELRTKGFGYRGRSIPHVAHQLLARPDGWLETMKAVDYAEAHKELCGLGGIGPKLADCICLFGLHHGEAAPVDTHLWQAACRLYFPELKGKALTDSRYRAVGDYLRSKFGPLTGWAHQYLFYENLLRRRGRA